MCWSKKGSVPLSFIVNSDSDFIGNMIELNNNFDTVAEIHDTGSIWQFYKNANILITGGSGFVGKALIEKLLRSCSGLNSIIILMRPKKGQTVEERMQRLLDEPVSLINNILYL